MKRSGIGSGALSRERGSTFKKPRSPRKRAKWVPVADRDAATGWYLAAVHWCQHPRCDRSSGLFELHHCVYAQKVRAENGSVFDPRNAMTLCDECHSSHHLRVDVIPLTALPASALEFAVELLGSPPAYEYLKRRYSGRDERLERVLHEGSPHPKVNEGSSDVRSAD